MADSIVCKERMYQGQGALKALTAELGQQGFKRAFVCTERELLGFEAVETAILMLRECGIAFCPYFNFGSGSQEADVRRAKKIFQAFGAVCVVAIGGEEAMELAARLQKGMAAEKEILSFFIPTDRLAAAKLLKHEKSGKAEAGAKRVVIIDPSMMIL